MNSTMSAQRRVLATSALVTLSVGYLATIQQGDKLPQARFIIGIGMSMTFCSILLDLGQGGLGAGFAVLIMLASLFNMGDDALKILATRAKRQPTKKNAARRGGRRPNTPNQQLV